MSLADIVYLSFLGLGGIAAIALISWAILYEGMSLGSVPSRRYLKVQARRKAKRLRG